MAGGVIALLNAGFHFVVKMQHPEFDQKVQLLNVLVDAELEAVVSVA